MKEPEFDATSLETPDVSPGGEPEQAEGRAEQPEQAQQAPGSSLEQQPGGEEFYVKAGTVKRRPKYKVFGVLGGLAGLIAGLILAQTGAIPQGQNYSRTDLAIVLVGLGIPAGVLISLFVALVFDRRQK